eukprot:gene17111-biopygen23323
MTERPAGSTRGRADPLCGVRPPSPHPPGKKNESGRGPDAGRTRTMQRIGFKETARTGRGQSRSPHPVLWCDGAIRVERVRDKGVIVVTSETGKHLLGERVKRAPTTVPLPPPPPWVVQTSKMSLFVGVTVVLIA